ncbi:MULTISPECIES: ribonuclease D [Microbacterium]|uniref:Ribonuclease D n=1 Tax=Microbacterium wangchenii TaxID=2541726 RepID=A0ABX5SUI1_9MICO|nr:MULTISPECIES: HRDC domain-containing protein [Microbacterium]MCK6065365.1 HRDC domain-containing protein [Microbacterium sp. EYE_512]QBR88807.1 ribonuclease D [Microbacterium wangchenii]
MTEYSVIADEEAFSAAVDALAAGTGPVAVDVERASGFRYSQRAYLIQVFRRGAGIYLFDPVEIADFAPLQEAIGDAEWVFHAASQDLPSLRERGLDPLEIFDTELAARLLGHERVGLGAVVESTLGITLAKAHSAADWSTRPLPQSWLEYAALDVAHLVDVRDALVAQLSEQGKTEYAAQEFEAVRARPPKPPRDDPWRRMSGLHTVRGRRALAVARSLWLAREEFAREQDVAPGRLVPDRSLVAAVIADPQSKQELAAIKDFNGRASRTQLDRWWNAIVAGREATELPPDRVPSDSLPPPRAWADRNPQADARLRAARPVVEARAQELGMPTENLLTPEVLRRVAWAPPAEITSDSIGEALHELGARPWQIEQTAQSIADAFVESVNRPVDATPDPS